MYRAPTRTMRQAYSVFMKSKWAIARGPICSSTRVTVWQRRAGPLFLWPLGGHLSTSGTKAGAQGDSGSRGVFSNATCLSREVQSDSTVRKDSAPRDAA